MVGSIGRWQQYCRWTLMACGALAFFLGLGGCAANGGASASESTADLVTPSDEPDARRRARIRLELASNYFEMGQTAVALDEVKQSLAADSSYADAYNLRGLIYLRLNDFAQAEESFRRAQALRPGDSSLLHNFGWLLCQQKKYVEADQQFLRALTNPGYVARSKTLMARGLCQVGAGQYAEAEQSLIKAYELDAANPVVGYHLSALLLRRTELSRAQALRPGDSNLLHNFGWLLCQQKKYAEADQQFVRALNNPGYVARSKTFMARGLCQVGAGQYAEAEQSLIKAYELDAANPVVGYHLSALLLRRNELSRAQFYIRRINNSEYANSESLWLGIKVERALGDIVASRQLADQLRKRFPDSREWGAFERGAFNE